MQHEKVFDFERKAGNKIIKKIDAAKKNEQKSQKVKDIPKKLLNQLGVDESKKQRGEPVAFDPNEEKDK